MCCHSTEEGRWLEKIIGRFLIMDSHIMKMNPMTAIKERREPKDDKTFQVVKASG